MIAAIKHVLVASREQGHCYLTEKQIKSVVIDLFEINLAEPLKESLIIKYAHQINRGETPYIDSPFKTPAIWKTGSDCLFIDSDEATQDQLGFITRVKRHFDWHTEELEQHVSYKPDENDLLHYGLFKMLYRNLIYTGLTRAKDCAVFVGTRKALSMAIRQQDVSQRQTALELLIKDCI